MQGKLSRSERQDLGIQRWKLSKGRGTCLYPTGFGKTKVALDTIERLRIQNPKCMVIVIVPTDYLRDQWNSELAKRSIEQVQVVIVNTAIKNTYQCDLLVVDEVHIMMAETFSRVFHSVQYKLLLCLTGTLDRLDGKEVLLKKYAPVCDVITLAEAVESKWVADFKQYKVLLDVDLSTYNDANQEFMHHFSFFNYDFPLAMRCVKGVPKVSTAHQVRMEYARELRCDVREVTAHTMAWLKAMQFRTAFIYDHPKKIEIVNKIICAREDKKIITFTKHVEHAKQICCGEIYHGRMNKKKKNDVMEHFNLIDVGVMNSCQALNVGADVQGVNTIIIISGDSSSITKRQRIGRGIRREEEKVAEVWQLVLRNTAEENWYRKSNKDLTTVTLDEGQLDHLLKHGTYTQNVDEKFLFSF